jgi:cytidylate kinase
MIITISGLTGSGKTTVARALVERLGFRHLSAGEVFRKMAEERGMSLLEFSRLAEEDHSLDREVDERQKRIAGEGDTIVDGRISGRILEADIAIWLKAPLEVRARRVARREGKDYEQALEETRRREESEKKRYREIYGFSMEDLSPYHLVFDTCLWSAETLVEVLEELIRKRRE